MICRLSNVERSSKQASKHTSFLGDLFARRVAACGVAIVICLAGVSQSASAQPAPSVSERAKNKRTPSVSERAKDKRTPSVSERAKNSNNPSPTAPVVAWPNPFQLYQSIGSTFWQAEHQLQSRVDPFSTGLSPYASPLPESDSLYQKYFYVDHHVSEYLQLLNEQNKQPRHSEGAKRPKNPPKLAATTSEKLSDRPSQHPTHGEGGNQKSASWTTPPMLYLGGIAAFTIGDYANAQKYFSRLLQNYPNYKRHQYINDRYAPNSDFAQPVKPGVTKLLFYCQIVGPRPAVFRISQGLEEENDWKQTSISPTIVPLVKGNLGGFSFQQFNQSAAKVLLSQRCFAKWLANRPYPYQRRNFFNENYGNTPDQRRASVLPAMEQFIETGWQHLFPKALKQDGAIAMRTYLRGLSTDDSLLKEIAMSRLAQVDQLVIKHYFAQAKVLLRKHRFDATRKKYKQIIAEYPNSQASQKAEAALPKVVPVAVTWYKKQGDIHFNPEGHVGVPQTKALAYFKKMYQEDPEGPKADYATYYWARALGTKGKFNHALQKLHGFEDEYPRSKLKSKALFLEGFLNGDSHVDKIDLAAKLMDQTAKLYPRSAEAPEALWYGAFYHAQLNQFAQATFCLDQLTQYPKSPRVKYVQQWRTYFQQKIQTGGQWP